MNKSDEPKPTAEEYQEKIIPEANEATLRLKQQLAELERSAELNRRQQQQADEINRQINEAFHFWKQAGLTADQEHILRANPAIMVQLSGFAANEAAKTHQVGTPEYVEAGKKLFFEHLTHLQEQARQHTAAQQPPEAKPAMEQIPPAPPGLLDPAPTPRPQRSARTSIVSAPVSRELPGEYRARECRQYTLSPAEAEAARISGVTPAEYLRQRERLREMRANGEYDSEPRR